MTPPLNKRLTSRPYRKLVKRFVQEVKTLRGLHRIGNAPARPTWGKTRLATKEEKAILDAQQEAYDTKWAQTPTRETCHFMLDQYTDDTPRRGRNR